MALCGDAYWFGILLEISCFNGLYLFVLLLCSCLVLRSFLLFGVYVGIFVLFVSRAYYSILLLDSLAWLGFMRY